VVAKRKQKNLKYIHKILELKRLILLLVVVENYCRRFSNIIKFIIVGEGK